jgi:glutamate-1-semialdehyde 2,1-aminomutase
MRRTIDELSAEERMVLARIRLSVTAHIVAECGSIDADIAKLAAKGPFILQLSCPGLPPAYVSSDRTGRLAAFAGGSQPPAGSPSMTLRFPDAASCAKLLAGAKAPVFPLPRGPGAFKALAFFRAAAARAPQLLAGEGAAPGARARLLAVAALRGLAETANADPGLSERLTHIPEGCMTVSAPGAFSFGVAKRGSLVEVLVEAPEKPNARLEFASPEAAVAVFSGARPAIVALGSGEVTLRGLLPLAQGLFSVLDRLGEYLAVKAETPVSRVTETAEPVAQGRSPTTSPAQPAVPRGAAHPAGATAAPSLSRSLGLFERAAKVIPGGIYGSKAPGFLVPGSYPMYMERAKGCRMWDADGNEYIDYLCGYGSQIVGYGNEKVDAAATARIRDGDLLDQPSPVMVELAERLVGLVEGSAWAVFVKNGTDATSLALSLARVRTGRRVAILAEGAYHGAANWCSSNLFPELAADRADIRHFPYGDVVALERLFAAERGQIACLFLTPYHHPTFKPQVLPEPAFYETAKKLCDAEGALLVMDDIRGNFRLHPRGSHVRFGAEPDLWCMGKALANGYPISVLLGTADTKATASSFFITGTYWMSGGPMAAAMATLDEMERLGGVPRLESLGFLLKDGLERAGREAGFQARVSGPPAIPFLTFDEDPDLYLNQRFGAAMARRGVFFHPHHNWFISLAHAEADIAATVERAREAFAAMREGRE